MYVPHREMSTHIEYQYRGKLSQLRDKLLNLEASELSDRQIRSHLRWPYTEEAIDLVKSLDFDYYANNLDWVETMELLVSSLNKTYREIRRIKEHGASHVHQGNMSYTYSRIIYKIRSKLSRAFSHNYSVDRDVVSWLLEFYQKSYEMLSDTANPLLDVLQSSFTQNEKDYLIRPWYYDFDNLHHAVSSNAIKRFKKVYNLVTSKIVDEYKRREELKEFVDNLKIIGSGYLEMEDA